MTSPLTEESLVYSPYGAMGHNCKCTYISDAIEGTYLVAESGKGQATPYNISTNIETSLMDLAKVV
jgi:nucleoside-diphosphate-sugar epimerase